MAQGCTHSAQVHSERVCCIYCTTEWLRPQKLATDGKSSLSQ